MKICIINGPNLNLLGTRETDIYGDESFEEYFSRLKTSYPEVELVHFQANSEGSLVDKLHEVGFDFDGIILNGAAYTHTSIALADAIAAIKTAVVEVHISNIHARESFRKHSMTAEKCDGVITGLGLKGYELALQYFLSKS